MLIHPGSADSDSMDLDSADLVPADLDSADLDSNGIRMKGSPDLDSALKRIL